MKKLISLFAALILVLTAVVSISATAAEADNILLNLLPAKDDMNGKVTTNNCDVTYNDDGTVTLTVTGADAWVNVAFKDGTTVIEEKPFKPAEAALVVYDYGSADGATLDGGTIIYYTRKDKDPESATLWLSSMQDTATYAQQSKVAGPGYGVWDLGDYLVNVKGQSHIFDDGVHHITSVNMKVTGPVGSSVTVYRLYMGNSAEIEGLGSVRPTVEVSEPEVSEPVSEAEISEAVSEAEVSEAVSEAEVSEAVSEAEVSEAVSEAEVSEEKI